MEVEYQNATSHGIDFRYSSTPISSLPLDNIRAEIHKLNLISGNLGCVVFEGARKSPFDLIIFAGNLERFAMLSVARYTGARVFYFQDSINWWYGGSPLLPDLRGINDFLGYHVGQRQCLAFGQSSGGYAALVAGALNPHYDVLACSPQTFPDAAVKQRLYVAPRLPVQRTPDFIMDIEKAYGETQRQGIAAALFSASEYRNPYDTHFWLDHLHLAKIAAVPAINTFIAASARHSIVSQRADLFAKSIKELLAVGKKKPSARLEVVRRLTQKIHHSEGGLSEGG